MAINPLLVATQGVLYRIPFALATQGFRITDAIRRLAKIFPDHSKPLDVNAKTSAGIRITTKPRR